jgi:hypothetical protein
MSERGDREVPLIYTIGHSTRSLDEFIGLLNAHRVTQLGDIRTVPRSRRHPHFAIDALSASLARASIAYRHFPGLGGLRGADRPTPRRYSGSRLCRLHGDAAFEAAIEQLLDFASVSAAAASRAARPTAIMCASRVVALSPATGADAPVARGVGCGTSCRSGLPRRMSSPICTGPRPEGELPGSNMRTARPRSGRVPGPLPVFSQ